MKNQIGSTITELLLVLIFAGGFVGWVWNIVKIIAVVNDPITGMFVFRCVGVVFAPLGAVLGYF